MTTMLALLILGAPPQGGPLSLEDLPAYKAALETAPVAAKSVGFRDLWDRSEAYRGRAVHVEGRIARRFRQGAVGQFPALSETWISSPAGDPICLVFPSAQGVGPPIGQDAEFSGICLKMIRYRGGDSDRLAPLIVSGAAPKAIQTASVRDSTPTAWSFDGLLGFGAGAFVLIVLGAKHWQRPSSRPIDLGPPPRFSDGEDDDGSD